ncbi:cupin-like domain-containing protein [Nannocystis sp. ILAH1]|uniref:cupin-like domain-containing protein n=1 Tax=unclassified Nannocystis TaxID=2627009 RepID=UPI00227084CF|nr:MULTISPECIES: cupin-like domain-containing protein [unclassified Nannocystis]MCY0988039.1 cupin-like domain-containing protein [Nannocystis sp. ILAH1]MCY1065579.1 cupin-like domain-containing protein [Nannocystis sp. RBIL2]
MHSEKLDVLLKPSPSFFVREYLRKGRPALLRGVADTWPAAAWTPEYLADRFGGLDVKYETWTDAADDLFEFQATQKHTSTTLREFVGLMRGAASPASRRVYLTAFELCRALPQSRQAFGSLDPFMGWSPLTPPALRERLRVEPYLWMGPAGTLSMLHFDRLHNFFVQLHGTKRFLHIDPQYSERLYYPHARLQTGLLHWSPVNPAQPDYERFPRFRGVPVIETIVERGDVLFTPPRWWHHVESLTPSISANFFWMLPLRTTWAIREYLYVLGRRRALEAAGLARVLPALESTA